MKRSCVLAAAAVSVMVAGCAGEGRPKAFDVTAYGARADGVHDNTPAIRAAIAAAEQAGGGRVLIPPAEKPYLITDSIELSSNIHLVGTGATVLLKDGAATGRTDPANFLHIVKIQGKPDAPLRHVTVEGLTIDANYWGQTNNTASYQASIKIAGNTRGIKVDHAQHVLIDKVTIRRPFAGLTFGPGSHHCEARDTTVTLWHHDAYGVTPERVDRGASNIVFRRCLAIDSLNGNQGGLPGTRVKGWEIEEGAQDIKLIDCVVKDTSANGFYVRPHWTRAAMKYATKNVEMIRCRVENAGRAAFMAKAYNHLQTVSNVRFIDCHAPAGNVQIMMNPADVVVRGGQFGSMTLGYYMDVDDPHHFPDGPWKQMVRLLPVRSVTVENVTIAGDVRVNAATGHDGASDYTPDLRLTNVAIKGDLYVVGSKDLLKTTDCTVAGAQRVLTPEQYLQVIKGPPPELATGAIKRCARPPAIDGKADDDCWKSVRPLDITNHWQKRTLSRGGHSFARLCFDDAAVYVLWECFEPNMKRLQTKVRGRDADMWFDDCVEVFFHRNGDPAGYFRQWMISAAGVLYDGDRDAQDKWNSSAKAAAGKLADRYVVELAIPWSDLGGRLKAGDTIKANLIRNRATNATRWIWSWRHDADGVFGNTDKMGTLTFK